MSNFNSKEWYISKVDGRITHILREPTKEDFKQQEEKIKRMFEFLERLYNI